MVRINGQIKDAAGKNVKDYLAEAGYIEETVVVEINLEIIPRTAYEEVILRDEDTVEILRFVGGGC